MVDSKRSLTPIRRQPWDWQTRNEYEEVTVREQPYLHGHYRNKYYKSDHDIYDPRYTAVRSSNWDAFRDSKKYWYTPYVHSRKKLADSVTEVFDRARRLGIYDTIREPWKSFSAQLYIPLRHYEYAGALQLQHVIRYAMGCPIEQCATYTAFDKQGRSQWLTEWGITFPGNETDTALQPSKQMWMEHESFRKLREYMEKLLVIEDWAEVIVASHLTIEPLLGRLVYGNLNSTALQYGDVIIPQLSLVCQDELMWEEQWTQKFIEFIVNDPVTNRWEYLQSLGYADWPGDYRWGNTLSDPRQTPEDPRSNREIVSEWMNQWLATAIAAIQPLQMLFDEHGIQYEVQDSIDSVIEETLIPFIKKMNLENVQV